MSRVFRRRRGAADSGDVDALLRAMSCSSAGPMSAPDLTVRSGLSSERTYAAVAVLERRGLVSGEWDRQVGGPPCRVFTLSASGRAEGGRRVAAFWKTSRLDLWFD